MAKQDLYSMHGTVNLKLLSENSFTIITAFISVLSRKRTLLKKSINYTAFRDPGWLVQQ